MVCNFVFFRNLTDLEGKRVISVTKSTTWVILLRMSVLFFGSICLMVQAESTSNVHPQMMLVKSAGELKDTLKAVSEKIEILLDLTQEDVKVPSLLELKFKESLGEVRNVLRQLDDGERFSQNLTKLLQLVELKIEKIGDRPSSQLQIDDLKSLQNSKETLKQVQAEFIAERDRAKVAFNNLLNMQDDIISSLETRAISEVVSKTKEVPIKIKELISILDSFADSATKDVLGITIPQQ